MINEQLLTLALIKAIKAKAAEIDAFLAKNQRIVQKKRGPKKCINIILSE